MGDDAPSQPQLNTSEKMLSGAVARVCGQTLLHPLEVVRTRMQIVGGGVGRLKLSTGIFAQAGLAAPSGLLQFTTAEYVRSALAPKGASGRVVALRRILGDLAAGAAGAAVATVVRVPQEVIKQGCMAGLYPNTFAAIATIWRLHGGPRGFYVGYWSQLQRDLWWNSLSFLFFHMQRRLWERWKGGRPCLVYENMMFGVSAGVLAALLTNPIDVLKTRMMTTQTMAADSDPYTGVFSMVREMIHHEGLGVTMRGILPRMMFLGPLSAIMLTVYEWFSQMLLHKRLRKQHAAARVSP